MTTQPTRAPAIDTMAILAGMQDQLDQLTATVAAQQQTIEQLLTERRR